MKVLLISMPDVIPIMIHEMAMHMPNHGLACIGGNIDGRHDVFLVDLVRHRGNLRKYLTDTLKRTRPDVIGLSAMTWQYDTCRRIIRFIKNLIPDVRIVLGGYHATLMAEEISESPEKNLIDFIVRGEGEETFRRLVNALEGHDRIEDIPSLSYRQDGHFNHNEKGALCDLSLLKLPIRDERRLTSGYHFVHKKIEIMETSRGCTRNCNFCSIRHMYGKTYRTYPIERIIGDLDDIYHRRNARMVFLADDNLVLNPKWVDEICEAILKKGYRDLYLTVQADCVSVAKNEAMIRKMASAGFKGIFLGIENVSSDNLKEMGKGDIAAVSKRAVEICHDNGMVVIGGMIFGMPDDDEIAIKKNYLFFKDLKADGAYCQIITPYPKTQIREDLLAKGLVSNPDDYSKYNGLLANVSTKHLSTDELQYYVWYYRQTALGWWAPSEFAKTHGLLWTSMWEHIIKPVMAFFYDRKVRRRGWKALYERDMEGLRQMNAFPDL